MDTNWTADGLISIACSIVELDSILGWARDGVAIGDLFKGAESGNTRSDAYTRSDVLVSIASSMVLLNSSDSSVNCLVSVACSIAELAVR